MTDYQDGDREQQGDCVPQVCGDNAEKWAQEFCKRYPQGLCQIDGHEGIVQGDDWEHIVMGWFANAIEHSYDVRTGGGPVILPDGSAFFTGTVKSPQ